MLKKIKGIVVSRREKKKNRSSLINADGLHSRISHIPQDQHLPSGPVPTATGSSTNTSPPEQRRIVPDPITGTSLHPPEQSSRTTGNSAYTHDYRQSQDERRIEQERRLKGELRTEEEGKAKGEGRVEKLKEEERVEEERKAKEEERVEKERKAKEEEHAEKERKAKEEEHAEKERKAKEEELVEKEKQAEEEREPERKRQEEEALETLATKSMPSAMLDSKDRGYVPRCNEDTRQTLRRRIVTWGRNHEDIQRLLWLLGPAGVGKSAVAQTVAEQLEKEGLLGAAFFFSRPNNRSDPDVVIPTLVYQLALLLPEYRRIVTQRLTTDPLVLARSRRSQFKELIVDPFLALTSHPPLLIVLDGLDECSDRDAQCEFVEMISYHIRKESNLRLRWMICSRPEPHLNVSFAGEDCKPICLQVKLEVEDSEAQKYARHILEKGFADIRTRYSDHVTEDWPSDNQIRFIADRASGHLGSVSFIIRFIGDKCYANPSSQLDVCLEFLRQTGGSTDVNPLLVLDLLYTQILSDIPANILPTTQRILALLIFYGTRTLTAAAHANFLGLDQATFYSSLQRLHSVISVPLVVEASTKPIQIYHASFSDYLTDPARSGKFVLEEAVVPYLEVAISSLRWLGYGHKDPSKRIEPELAWTPSKASRGAVLNSLCRFSFVPCWKACPKVPEESRATLFEVLKKFDFNLKYEEWWKCDTREFAYFIQWLATSGNQHGILVSSSRIGKMIRILHKDDPSIFLATFSEDIMPQYSSTIYASIGINNPIKVRLEVGGYTPSFSRL